MSRRRNRGNLAPARKKEQKHSTAGPPTIRQPPPTFTRGAEAVEHQEELFPAQIALHAATFSGPLPPPDLLREYEAVLPGLATRIVDTAESEARHRHSIESSLLNLSFLGLGVGALIVLVALLAGVWLLYRDKNVGGLVALVGALVALAAAFMGRASGPPVDTTLPDAAEEPKDR